MKKGLQDRLAKLAAHHYQESVRLHQKHLLHTYCTEKVDSEAFQQDLRALVAAHMVEYKLTLSAYSTES
jgi:hypothetical protein